MFAQDIYVSGIRVGLVYQGAATMSHSINMSLWSRGIIHYFAKGHRLPMDLHVMHDIYSAWLVNIIVGGCAKNIILYILSYTCISAESFSHAIVTAVQTMLPCIWSSFHLESSIHASSHWNISSKPKR